MARSTAKPFFTICRKAGEVSMDEPAFLLTLIYGAKIARKFGLLIFTSIECVCVKIAVKILIASRGIRL